MKLIKSGVRISEEHSLSVTRRLLLSLAFGVVVTAAGLVAALLAKSELLFLACFWSLGIFWRLLPYNPDGSLATMAPPIQAFGASVLLNVILLTLFTYSVSWLAGEYRKSS